MFWAIFTALGFVCPKMGKMALLRKEIFFLKYCRSYWILKNREFYAGFKNVNMPQ
jgi:hypothetical protein